MVATGFELALHPADGVGELPAVGVFDHGQDPDGLVPGDAEQVADELAGPDLGSAGDRLHQDDAPGQQLPAMIRSLGVLGLPASSLLDLGRCRPVRVGTGGWGGIKGGVRGCRGRGATIQGGAGGVTRDICDMRDIT